MSLDPSINRSEPRESFRWVQQDLQPSPPLSQSIHPFPGKSTRSWRGLHEPFQLEIDVINVDEKFWNSHMNPTCSCRSLVGTYLHYTTLGASERTSNTGDLGSGQLASSIILEAHSPSRAACNGELSNFLIQKNPTSWTPWEINVYTHSDLYSHLGWACWFQLSFFKAVFFSSPVTWRLFETCISDLDI